MLPDAIRGLFWDIDADHFDAEAFPQYTIERVLEYGDRNAVDWLRSLFPAEVIANALRNSRRLTARSANFWALVLGVPHEQVRALQSHP